MREYNQGLFYEKIPKLVQLLFIIFFSVVLFGITPIYTTNIPYIANNFGISTDYLLWANYVSVIGMGISLPLVIRLKARFRSKEIMITSFVSMAILFILMGIVKNPKLFIWASLLIGFFRIVAMIEIALPLMVIISPDGNKGKFYSVFYTSILVITQITGYGIVSISDQYSWQYAYFLIAIICLIVSFICVLFQHNKRFIKKVPLYYIDWVSVVLFTLSLIDLAYIISYGKTEAWFDSISIRWATLFFFISFFILILRQQIIKRPFIFLDGFKKNNVIHGIIMLFFLGMFLATTTIQNIFGAGILRYNQTINASLNLMMIPGLILGFYISFKCFTKKYSVILLIFSGFSSFMVYSIIMYFSMVPEFNYQNWVLPMIFKGYGMGVLFIAIWFYTFDNLSVTEIMASMAFILVWRSFITLGGFTAIFSWMQYKLQLQSLGNLAVYMDDIMLFGSGKNIAYFNGIQINGVLLANKKLLGYIIILGFGVLLYIFLLFLKEKNNKVDL